jgi:hypothetical protein
MPPAARTVLYASLGGECSVLVDNFRFHLTRPRQERAPDITFNHALYSTPVTSVKLQVRENQELPGNNIQNETCLKHFLVDAEGSPVTQSSVDMRVAGPIQASLG